MRSTATPADLAGEFETVRAKAVLLGSVDGSWNLDRA
jgi:hypothetical protein